MLNLLKRMTWQERVRVLYSYQQESKLSIRNLADEVESSIGRVQYELALAEALDKFPELLEMKKITDAIKFIKKKKFRRDC